MVILMPALSTLEKALAAVVAGLLLVIAIGGFGYWNGYHKCANADTVAVAKDVVHNAEVQDAGTAANLKVETHYDATLAIALAPLPDVSRLGNNGVHQPSGCPVSRAAAHSGASLGGTDVRTVSPPSVVPGGWNPFERSDVQDGHDADAKVIYLQGLLTDMYEVCTGQVLKAPP